MAGTYPNLLYMTVHYHCKEYTDIAGAFFANIPKNMLRIVDNTALCT